MTKNGKVTHISDLIPDASNANKGTHRGLALLDDSLRKHGAGRSILIDKNGRIIAGNKTAERAADIGLDEVIVVQTDGKKLVAVQRMDLDLESDPEARTLAYLDNRVGEIDLSWNIEQLLADYESGIDISSLWSDQEMAALLEGAADGLLGDGSGKDAEPQIDKAAELQKQWGTAVGQVWELGVHRLAVGDCTDRAVVEAVMGGERAKAVVTDPPYGIDWDTDYTRFTNGEKRTKVKYEPIHSDNIEFDPRPLLDFDAVVLWGANFYGKYLPIGSWLIWDKREDNGTAWLADAEVAWMKGGYGAYICPYTGPIRENRGTHPTQKRVDVVQWCIEKCKAGDTIYDPFLGSGTTLIACHNLNRRCRGIEISPSYSAVCLQRFFDASGIEPKLL